MEICTSGHWDVAVITISNRTWRLTLCDSTWELLANSNTPQACTFSQTTCHSCFSLKYSMRLCAQSCPTLCNPMDCSPPGSSIYGIFQVRLLEWVAISFSRGIFLTQGSNPCLLCLLHCRWILYSLSNSISAKKTDLIIKLSALRHFRSWIYSVVERLKIWNQTSKFQFPGSSWLWKNTWISPSSFQQKGYIVVLFLWLLWGSNQMKAYVKVL